MTIFHRPVIEKDKPEKKTSRKINVTEGQTSLLSGYDLSDLLKQRRVMWSTILNLEELYIDFKNEQWTLREVGLIARGEMDPTLLAIDIQRYGDRRMNKYRWWLMLLSPYEQGEPYSNLYSDEWAIFNTAPRLYDYEYDSYWVNAGNYEGIVHWVKARAGWAFMTCSEKTVSAYYTLQRRKQFIKKTVKVLRESRIPLYTEKVKDILREPNN